MRKYHFVLRRLHSLCGIVPIGAFLCFHLLTNSTAFEGPERFNEHVKGIHALPWLVCIEVLFIFLPIAFHAGYGVLIALQGNLNTRQYPYMDNWRYTLQRVTAWIALAFIAIHLLQFRFAHWFGAMSYQAAATYSPGGYFGFTQHGFAAILPEWLWILIYLVGLSACVFHFCNGIVTFCITWGIAVGAVARKHVSVVAAGLAVVLMIFGVASLVAIARGKPTAGNPGGAGAVAMRAER